MSDAAPPEPKPIDPPLSIRMNGGEHRVATVQDALLLLSSVDWPGERTDLHADAVETCLKVIDGHRSVVDARTRFLEAAAEAGLSAS